MDSLLIIRLSLETRAPCQHFTAVGRVKNGEVYQFDMGSGFMPYRLDIDFSSCRDVAILPLLDQLSFTKDKKIGQTVSLRAF